MSPPRAGFVEAETVSGAADSAAVNNRQRTNRFMETRPSKRMALTLSRSHFDAVEITFHSLMKYLSWTLSGSRLTKIKLK